MNKYKLKDIYLLHSKILEIKSNKGNTYELNELNKKFNEQKKTSKYNMQFIWRKISLILIAFISISIIVLSIIQIQNFDNYKKMEVWLKSQLPKSFKNIEYRAHDQKDIAYTCFIMCIVISSISLISAISGLCLLILSKYDAYVNLRIITWIFIVSILFEILALAIKLDKQFIKDPNIPLKRIYIQAPNYTPFYIVLFLSLFSSIISAISRKESGYLLSNKFMLDNYVKKNSK